MKRNNGKKKPGCYAYTIGNGEENATSIDVKKSIWTAWAERLNQKSNWVKLVNVGTCAFVAVLALGLLWNHWVGLATRITVSMIYVILMVVLHRKWKSDTETRGRVSYLGAGTTINEARFFWLDFTKSIASLCLYLVICLTVPCFLLSNWSGGEEYVDSNGHMRNYDPYYYQSGQEFTRPYPTFWAWPWVKIAVLPPITDGSLTVSIGKGKEVEIEYTAEYSPAEPREILEVFCANNTSASNKEMVDSSICVLVRSEMEKTSLPKEALVLKKPLNTTYLAEDVTTKVDKVKDEIAGLIKSERLIPCVKITSLKFPT